VADSAVGNGEGQDPSKTTAKSGPLPLLYSLYARWSIFSILFFQDVRGASKIKLKKVNKRRTVTVRRVIIFLNISRCPLLICLYCCLH
jgi:hypothetical protein